jgi:hypothetical protein
MGSHWPPTTKTTTIDAAATADDTTDATTETRITIHPRVHFELLLALQMLAFKEVLAL